MQVVLFHYFPVMLFSFLIGRAVQGLGVGACASVILPALMDIFKGEELLHKILMINLAYGIAPIIAPYIGGVILLFFGLARDFPVYILLYFCIDYNGKILFLGN